MNHTQLFKNCFHSSERFFFFFLPPFYFKVNCFLVLREPPCVAQAGLRIPMPLSLPPAGWDHPCVSTQHSYTFFV